MLGLFQKLHFYIYFDHLNKYSLMDEEIKTPKTAEQYKA